MPFLLRQSIDAVLRRLDELAAERSLPRQIVDPVRAHHQERLAQLDYRMGSDASEQQLASLSDELEELLIEAEREHLYRLLGRGELKDDARRRIESELDLREAHLMRSTRQDEDDDV
jgi:hypothetical protein